MMLSSFRITFIFPIVGMSLVHQTTLAAIASGFLFYNHNAAATALATAVIAQIDNPSAFFYNPAAINHLKGTQTSFGTTTVMSTTKRDIKMVKIH
jgi:long-subunit fatty acid transport protein